MDGKMPSCYPTNLGRGKNRGFSIELQPLDLLYFYNEIKDFYRQKYFFY